MGVHAPPMRENTVMMPRRSPKGFFTNSTAAYGTKPSCPPLQNVMEMARIQHAYKRFYCASKAVRRVGMCPGRLDS